MGTKYFVGTEDVVDGSLATADYGIDSITRSKQANGSVTTDGSDPGEGGLCYSDEVTSFSTSSTSFVDTSPVLSCTITLTGRPYFIGLVNDYQASAAVGEIRVNNNSASPENCDGFVRFLRDGTNISQMRLGMNAQEEAGANARSIAVPPSSFWFIDSISSGTYTFKSSVRVNNAAYTIFVTRTRLLVFEL